MKMMPKACLCALLAACSGTGGGKDASADTDAEVPEVVGLYRVNSQSEDDACTGNYVETLPIPFFELRADGADVAFYVCRTESDCDDTPDSSRALGQKKNGDWGHTERWASMNDSDPASKYCEFNVRVSHLIEKGGDKYTIDSNKFQEAIQDQSVDSQEDCDDKLADWSPSGDATESQCERIQATKVK